MCIQGARETEHPQEGENEQPLESGNYLQQVGSAGHPQSFADVLPRRVHTDYCREQSKAADYPLAVYTRFPNEFPRVKKRKQKKGELPMKYEDPGTNQWSKMTPVMARHDCWNHNHGMLDNSQRNHYPQIKRRQFVEITPTPANSPFGQNRAPPESSTGRSIPPLTDEMWEGTSPTSSGVTVIASDAPCTDRQPAGEGQDVVGQANADQAAAINYNQEQSSEEESSGDLAAGVTSSGPDLSSVEYFVFDFGPAANRKPILGQDSVDSAGILALRRVRKKEKLLAALRALSSITNEVPLTRLQLPMEVKVDDEKASSAEPSLNPKISAIPLPSCPCEQCVADAAKLDSFKKKIDSFEPKESPSPLLRKMPLRTCQILLPNCEDVCKGYPEQTAAPLVSTTAELRDEGKGKGMDNCIASLDARAVLPPHLMYPRTTEHFQVPQPHLKGQTTCCFLVACLQTPTHRK